MAASDIDLPVKLEGGSSILPQSSPFQTSESTNGATPINGPVKIESVPTNDINGVIQGSKCIPISSSASPAPPPPELQRPALLATAPDATASAAAANTSSTTNRLLPVTTTAEEQIGVSATPLGGADIKVEAGLSSGSHHPSSGRDSKPNSGRLSRSSLHGDQSGLGAPAFPTLAQLDQGSPAAASGTTGPTLLPQQRAPPPSHVQLGAAVNNTSSAATGLPPTAAALSQQSEPPFMQNQNQIAVFTTHTANKAAEAVVRGQFSSIMAYHANLVQSQGPLPQANKNGFGGSPGRPSIGPPDEFSGQNPVSAISLWVQQQNINMQQQTPLGPASVNQQQQHQQSVAPGPGQPPSSVVSGPPMGRSPAGSGVPMQSRMAMSGSMESNMSQSPPFFTWDSSRGPPPPGLQAGVPFSGGMMGVPPPGQGIPTVSGVGPPGMELGKVHPGEGLTAERLQRREEQLARLGKLHEMLFPEQRNKGMMGPGGPMPPGHVGGPPMMLSPQMMNPEQYSTPGSIQAQREWLKLTQEHYAKKSGGMGRGPRIPPPEAYMFPDGIGPFPGDIPGARMPGAPGGGAYPPDFSMVDGIPPGMIPPQMRMLGPPARMMVPGGSMGARMPGFPAVMDPDMRGPGPRLPPPENELYAEGQAFQSHGHFDEFGPVVPHPGPQPGVMPPTNKRMKVPSGANIDRAPMPEPFVGPGMGLLPGMMMQGPGGMGKSIAPPSYAQTTGSGKRKRGPTEDLEELCKRLEPVPSPQQLGSLQQFEGQELTITKQLNTAYQQQQQQQQQDMLSASGVSSLSSSSASSAPPPSTTPITCSSTALGCITPSPSSVGSTNTGTTAPMAISGSSLTPSVTDSLNATMKGGSTSQETTTSNSVSDPSRSQSQHAPQSLLGSTNSPAPQSSRLGTGGGAPGTPGVSTNCHSAPSPITALTSSSSSALITSSSNAVPSSPSVRNLSSASEDHAASSSPAPTDTSSSHTSLSRSNSRSKKSSSTAAAAAALPSPNSQGVVGARLSHFANSPSALSKGPPTPKQRQQQQQQHQQQQQQQSLTSASGAASGSSSMMSNITSASLANLSNLANQVQQQMREGGPYQNIQIEGNQATPQSSSTITSLPPSVNNTYVNATMSIQQLNIQSVNQPGAQGSMQIQQMAMDQQQQQFTMSGGAPPQHAARPSHVPSPATSVPGNANVQVQAKAPNTIQYLPANPPPTEPTGLPTSRPIMGPGIGVSMAATSGRQTRPALQQSANMQSDFFTGQLAPPLTGLDAKEPTTKVQYFPSELSGMAGMPGRFPGMPQEIPNSMGIPPGMGMPPMGPGSAGGPQSVMGNPRLAPPSQQPPEMYVGGGNGPGANPAMFGNMPGGPPPEMFGSPGMEFMSAAGGPPVDMVSPGPFLEDITPPPSMMQVGAMAGGQMQQSQHMRMRMMSQQMTGPPNEYRGGPAPGMGGGMQMGMPPNASRPGMGPNMVGGPMELSMHYQQFQQQDMYMQMQQRGQRQPPSHPMNMQPNPGSGYVGIPPHMMRPG